MSILCVTQQGTSLTKKGNRLVVEKMGEAIQWVHAFKVRQVVLMGHIRLSPAVTSFLLEQGIDTVFLSLHGKYRGRLISEFSKNIELRRQQFLKLGEPAFALDLARSYVRGKVENCRILLRRHNRELQNETIIDALNKLRVMVRRLGTSETNEQLMGMEGAAAAAYFAVFGQVLRVPEMPFAGRNRRPRAIP